MQGDSFIVAFPHPAAALRCCAELQSALLAAAWPPELLQQAEACYPVYASPRCANTHANNATTTPAQTDTTPCTQVYTFSHVPCFAQSSLPRTSKQPSTSSLLLPASNCRAPREQQAQLATRFGSHGTFVAHGHRSLSASSVASTFHQSACTPRRPDTGTGLIPDSGPSVRGRAARTLILNQHLSQKQLQLHPWQHSLSHADSEEPPADTPAQRNSCASSALAVSRSENFALSGLALPTCRSGEGFALMSGRVAFASPRAHPELPASGSEAPRFGNSRSGRVVTGLGGSAGVSDGLGRARGATQQLTISVPDQQVSSPPDSSSRNALPLSLERTSFPSPWGPATAAAAVEAAAAASLATGTGLDAEDPDAAERPSFMLGSGYCSSSAWQQQRQLLFEETLEATFNPMIGGSAAAAPAAAAAAAATFPAAAATAVAPPHGNTPPPALPQAPTDPAAPGSPLGTSPATVTFTRAPAHCEPSVRSSHASTPNHLSHTALSRKPVATSRPTSPMPSGSMHIASRSVHTAQTAELNVFYSTPCFREDSIIGGPGSNQHTDVGSLQPPQRPRSLALASTSFGFGLHKLHGTTPSLPGTLASLRKIVRLPESGFRARSTGGGALPRAASSGSARSVSVLGAAPPLGGVGSGFGGGGAGGGAGGPQVSLWSWGNELQAAWTVQREPEAGSVPVYRWG